MSVIRLPPVRARSTPDVAMYRSLSSYARNRMRTILGAEAGSVA